MGVVLVYDCTDERSFADIRNWIKQIDNHAHHNIAKVLVAAKCDLLEKKVEPAVGKALAEELKIEFFETSAKSNRNVEQAFKAIAEQVIKSEVTFSELKNTMSVQSSDAPRGKRGCC